jgi:hypothetical protein
MPVRHHAALGRQEEVDRERIDAAVRLRHAGDADEAVILDVGKRGLDQRRHTCVVGHLHIEHGAVARLERQHGAVDLLDLAADTARLLRECGGRKK